MKYLYSLIIALVVFSVTTEAYYCIIAPPSDYLPDGVLARLIFYFSFFTILSSLALATGCLLTIIKPYYNSQAMTVLRMDGVIGVIITGLVYNISLRAIHHPELLLLKITNECLHVIVPLLGVVGWLLFDPRRRVTKRSIFYAAIPPLIYVLYTFLRGALTGFYPYPLLNVGQIGYLHATLNTSLVAIVFLLFAVLLYFLDNYWLVKRPIKTT